MAEHPLPHPTDLGTCVRKGCTTVRSRLWRNASAEVREVWKAAGLRRAHSHGLCATCYQWATEHGCVQDFRSTPAPPRRSPCVRCGLTTTERLCTDCTDVVTDLGETDAWRAEEAPCAA